MTPKERKDTLQDARLMLRAARDPAHAETEGPITNRERITFAVLDAILDVFDSHDDGPLSTQPQKP